MLRNPWVKWVLSLGILFVLLWRLDGHDFINQFRTVSWPVFMAAIFFALLAIVGSAWRWHYTAQQLNLTLSHRQAINDYFLAALINQTLPGGILGDITRAVRHGDRLPQLTAQGRWGAAFRAVVIERLSGQLILPPLLMFFWLITPTGQALLYQFGFVLTFIMIGLVSVGIGFGWLLRRRQWLYRLKLDLKRTLLSMPSGLIQMISSAAVLGCFIVAFILAARALAIETPSTVMLPLIPLVLLAMIVPISVSGWGVREGVAALLWPIVGLPAEQGVAISVTYGAVMFLSSLPGLIPLLYGPLKSISNRVS